MQTLEELAEFVRENIPQSKAVSHLTVNATAQIISFRWNSMEFAVRQSLEVFQVKGTRVEITAASLLLQAILQSSSRVAKLMGAVVESLGQAQDFFKRNEASKGMELLIPAKKAIEKLAQKRVPA